MEFVVCLENKDYPADLQRHKLYRVIPEANMGSDDIRMIDESGEDYLYPKSLFAPIEVPVKVRESFLQAA